MADKMLRKASGKPVATRADKSINQATIARAAGVSRSVISSFFNNKFYGGEQHSVIGISAETRARILEVCRDLNFEPKDPILHANIYPERTETTFLLNGHVTDGIENSLFSLIFEGVSRGAIEQHVRTSYARFMRSRDYMSQRDPLTNTLFSGALRKFVLGGGINYSLLASLQGCGAALAYVLRKVDVRGVVSVVPDFERATRLALQTLYDHGHRSIALVADFYFTPDMYSYEVFVSSARAFFAERGLTPEPEVLHFEQTGLEDPSMGEVVERVQRDYTAVFCLDDWSAKKLITAATERGLRVPECFSVIGCNDDRTAAYTEPPLTSVNIHALDIGKTAAEAVVANARRDPVFPPETILMPVSLTLRQTVDAPNLQAV